MTKRVLFFSPFGSFQVHHQLDVLIGTSLRLRGAEVLAVRCHGMYPSCDVLAWSGERSAIDCANCAKSGEALFAAFEFPRIDLNSLVTEEDRALVTSLVAALPEELYPMATVLDLPFGAWVTSSVCSFLRVGREGLGHPAARGLYRQYLINCVLTWKAMARLAESFPFSHIVLFNGRYAPYRVALEFGRHHSIPVVTHERAYVNDAFFLFENHASIESKPFHDCVAAWKDVPLDDDAISEVSANAQERELGRGTNFTPFIVYQTEIESVKRSLNIPADAEIVTVLTSSEFELAYSKDFETAISQSEAIQRLVEVFRGRKEYLVIRHHPYIGGMAESPPDYKFLRHIHELTRNLPENVRVILPSEIINTYALLGVSTAAIAFLSTIGVEAALRGVPTASFANSFYRDAMTEVIRDVSVDGFRGLVERLLSHAGVASEENLTRAYRTYHAIFFRLSQQFRVCGIRNIFEPDIRLQRIEELLPGQDETLDRVCNHILQGDCLNKVPDERDAYRSLSSERRYMRDEVTRLREQRDGQRIRIQEMGRSWEPSVLWVSLEDGADSSSHVRQRHQRIVHRSLAKGAAFEQMLSQLSDLLTESEADYVYVADSSVFVGEAVLSTLVSALQATENQRAFGARMAGWITDSTGLPLCGVFSSQHPVLSVNDLQGDRSILRRPETLLAFHLFRRQWLLRSLSGWLEMGEESMVADLIDAGQGAGICKLALQALEVPKLF